MNQSLDNTTIFQNKKYYLLYLGACSTSTIAFLVRMSLVHYSIPERFLVKLDESSNILPRSSPTEKPNKKHKSPFFPRISVLYPFVAGRKIFVKTFLRASCPAFTRSSAAQALLSFICIMFLVIAHGSVIRSGKRIIGV
jgi:hypothetical protein